MKTRQHTVTRPWKIALSSLVIAAAAASGMAVAQTTDTTDSARQQRMDDALQSYRSGGRTGTARDTSDTAGMGPAARTEESIKRGARKTGHAVAEGARKTGHAVAQGARKTGHAIKRATNGKAGTANPATTPPASQ